MNESQDGRGYGLGQVGGEWPVYQPPDEQDVELASWFVAKFGPGWVPNPNGSGALLGVPSGGEDPSASVPLSSEWQDAGCVDDDGPAGRFEWRVVGDPTVTLPDGTVQHFPAYVCLFPSEEAAREFVAPSEAGARLRWASGPTVQRRFVTEWEDA